MTYLFSFCITSILVMGAFAGLWGEMSYRLGCVRWGEGDDKQEVGPYYDTHTTCRSLNQSTRTLPLYHPLFIISPHTPIPTTSVHWRERKVAFGFQIFSALLSLTVGVLWLVLKSLGLLEQVFG